MAKQTLKQAIHLGQSGKSKSLSRAICYLHGCPVGGWPETEQAMMRIADELPFRSDRSYTIDEFVASAYEVDFARRYRTR